MFQGFYNLASGMITQNQNLNVISNNMVNTATPGYKADTYTATAFHQEMLYRMGNVDKKNQMPIGNTYMARVGDVTVTNYTEGGKEETGQVFDFAINGPGFFKVATPTGYAYTRNGSFYMDEEGYLTLQGIGRVEGGGGEIQLESDNITIDGEGMLYYANGEEIDNLMLVDFEDYTLMTKGANSTFTTNQEELEVELPNIQQKYLEGSNVEPIKEMSNMITSQRSLQSAAQLLKMYDQMMNKATNEIGKI